MKKTAITVAALLGLAAGQQTNCVQCMLANKCWHNVVGTEGYSCSDTNSVQAWSSANGSPNLWTYNWGGSTQIPQYYYCHQTEINLGLAGVDEPRRVDRYNIEDQYKAPGSWNPNTVAQATWTANDWADNWFS